MSYQQIGLIFLLVISLLNNAVKAANLCKPVAAGWQQTALMKQHCQTNKRQSLYIVSYIQQPIDTGVNLQSVSFLSDNTHAWGASDRGLLFKTNDSGKSWQEQKDSGVKDLEEVYFAADGRHGLAIGRKGLVFSTLDGGGHWEKQTIQEVRSIANQFKMSARGKYSWVVDAGDLYVATFIDKGIHWLKQTNNSKVILSSVAFWGDGQYGWGIGIKEQFQSTNPGFKLLFENKSLFKTEDGGRNWKEQILDIDHIGKSNIYFAEDGLHGLLTLDSKDFVIVTQDGGKNWKKQTIPTSNYIRNANITSDGQRTWLFGDSDNLLSIVNDGGSWSKQAIRPDGAKNKFITYVTFAADGHIGWALDSSGNLLSLKPSNHFYPTIFAFKIEHTPTKEVLKLRIDPGSGGCGTTQPNVKLSSKPFEGSGLVEWAKPTAAIATLSIPFEPGKHNLLPNSKYNLHVDLTCGDKYSAGYDIDGLTVGDWVENNIPGGRATTLCASLFVAYLMLCGLSYWLFPGWLLTVRRSVFNPVLDVLPKTLTVGLHFLAEIAGLWLCRRPRVLDAWVNTHYETWYKNLVATEHQVFDRAYKPLPIEIGLLSRTETVNEPSPLSLGRFFGEKARAVQIEAVGGAGKTTLAMQICLWLLGKDGTAPMGSYRRLPIWLDGDASDLKSAVDGKLNLLLFTEGSDVSPLDKAWRDTLINRGRICIVMDRLSEQSVGTQNAILGLHEIWPGALVILTTRHYFQLRSHTLIRPLPLDSLEIIASLIAHELKHSKPDSENSASATLERGGEIVHALTNLVSQTDSQEKSSAVTPLLIGLFVIAALKLLEEGVPLDALPKTVPQTYSDYVKNLFKTSGNQEQDLSMLSAAMDLAMAALGERFVPGVFGRNAVIAKFTKEKALGRFATFELMLEAGLLQKVENVGDDVLLRFVLDPVAEHLAALRHADMCNDDVSKWEALIQSVKESTGSEGFLTALKNIYRAYCDTKHWPKLPELLVHKGNE